MAQSSPFSYHEVHALGDGEIAVRVAQGLLSLVNGGGAISKKKVFVVDDEVQIAEVLTLSLREAELDVETFNDARSALLRARKCQPDVLVSDISMPGIDGITLAKALREQYPKCKIILISGNPNWKTREDWRGDKLEGFVLLAKPFSLSQLLRLIQSDES